ncbi:cytochrome c1 heme lyase [Phyllosticta citribraziliensis]|uniref:Holocytochrome c-type synthase n=1 Tax=Phyllosticta citribraziliensis TaxID=989973 RepID=A0ABR1LF53_9PEZI
MGADGDAEPSVCPVDHKSREAWMAQAKAAGAQQPDQHPPHPIPPVPAAPPKPADPGCDSSKMDQKAPAQTAGSKVLGALGLSQDREISTIPRSFPEAKVAAAPANNEQESGADKSSGNWIYPSEEMFFNAMKRKNFDPRAEDLHSIVPIHNAVNERAWKEIKQWEAGRGSDVCGGPKLVSFSGNSQKLTPRARLNTLLGYQPPFDRHDWIVDRCGTQVEYVIDFYSGKNEGRPGKSLNFYLDVRPKLNSWEAVKTRMMMFMGM